MSLTVGSLFAGVGGFDIAAERAGMEVLWQSETEKSASAVLEHHWPGLNMGDIHDIRMEGQVEHSRHIDRVRTVPSVSVIGAPSFGESVLRNTRNNRGEPDGRRRTVATVDVLCGGFPCQDYSSAGRMSGLAGDRGALWWEFHRLIDEGRPKWVIGENVVGLLHSNSGRDFATIVDSLTELRYGVVWGVLSAEYFGLAQRRNRIFIVGHSGGIPRPEILALSEGMFSNPEPSRKEAQTLAATIETRPTPDRGRAELGHIVYSHETTVRRLTPLECERLQGFPDGWTDIPRNADWKRYRQMGNAVAVPVAEWIMKRITALYPRSRM